MNRSRYSLRAICAGFLADILASHILVSALTLAIATKTFGAPLPSASLGQMLNSLQSVPAFFLPATALGLLGSTIGGYVAAHLSGRDDAWRNAIAAGAFSLLLSLTAVFDSNGTPPPVLAVALCLSLPATLLGAFLCISGRDAENAAPTDSEENRGGES